MNEEFTGYKAFFARAQTVRAADPETLKRHLAEALKDPEFIRTNGNAGMALKRANPTMYHRIQKGLPAREEPSELKKAPTQKESVAPSEGWQDIVLKQFKALEAK